MTQTAPSQIDSAHAPPEADEGDWFVGPRFDLLVIVNISWLLALMPIYVADGRAQIEFWQVYFLTAPHRWLSLIVAVSDEKRRGARGHLLLAGLAIGLAAVVAAVGVFPGGVAILLLADLCLGGFHYADQHARIYRMYAARSGGASPLLCGLLFAAIPYTVLRAASRWAWWLVERPDWQRTLDLIDWLVLLMLGAAIGGEYLRGGRRLDIPEEDQANANREEQTKRVRPRRSGTRAYLWSVCVMYGLWLWATHCGWTRLGIALAAASAAFHATESLAVTTCYAWVRRAQGGSSLFVRLTQNWLSRLAEFLLIVGLVEYFARATATAACGDAEIPCFWGTIVPCVIVWSSLLHYAIEGFQWLGLDWKREIAWAEVAARNREGAPCPAGRSDV